MYVWVSICSLGLSPLYLHIATLIWYYSDSVLISDKVVSSHCFFLVSQVLLNLSLQTAHMRACALSHFSRVLLFVTVAHQATLSIGFSRQEYWSGLPCPPPGHLSDPGMELTSLTSLALAGGFFTTSATWKTWSGTYFSHFPGTGLPALLLQVDIQWQRVSLTGKFIFQLLYIQNWTRKNKRMVLDTTFVM